MRERTEPAPLAPEPPRWPGPGLRPGLGPAAARAGGCREAPVGVRSGAGPARRLSPGPFGPSPPRRKGRLRAAARCDTAVAQPGGRRCPRSGGGTARQEPQRVARQRPAARGAGRRVSRCAP